MANEAGGATEYLTDEEAALYLRLPVTRGGKRVLLRAVDDGQLRSVSLGRQRLYRRRWLDQFMESLAERDRPKRSSSERASGASVASGGSGRDR